MHAFHPPPLSSAQLLFENRVHFEQCSLVEQCQPEAAAHFRIGKVKVSFVEGTDAPSESSQESEGTGPYQNFSSVETQRDRRIAYKAVVFSEYCGPFRRGFGRTYWVTWSCRLTEKEI
jgi:hypothetical protein